MTARWELHFDGMPPNLLNARLSVRARIQAVKLWRERAAWHARQAGLPRLERARLSAVFTRRALGVADEDGDHARCKMLVDGLVRAGVLPQDTRSHVEWGPILEQRGLPGVTLIVEALT
jgi:hypothetical protein